MRTRVQQGFPRTASSCFFMYWNAARWTTRRARKCSASLASLCSHHRVGASSVTGCFISRVTGSQADGLAGAPSGEERREREKAIAAWDLDPRDGVPGGPRRGAARVRVWIFCSDGGRWSYGGALMGPVWAKGHLAGETATARGSGSRPK